MGLDTIHLETSGGGEKINKNTVVAELHDIANIRKYIGKLPVNKQEDRLKNIQLQHQIIGFLEKAANNQLAIHMSEFNAHHFDNDGEKGLNKVEFEKFSRSMQSAIEQIVLLDSAGSFDSIVKEAKDTAGVSNSEIVKEQHSFITQAISKVGTITPSELEKMKDKQFSLSPSGLKELSILLVNEVGSQAEDLIRFLINIPKGIVLSPNYIGYRLMKNIGTLESQTEYGIKCDILVKENPSLAIGELLGEKGIQMIAQIRDMMTSGKQGDIATILVSLSSVIVGGAASIAKVASSNARKLAVQNARLAGFEGRKTGNLISKETRNELKNITNTADKVINISNSVDSILSGGSLLKNTGRIIADTLPKNIVRTSSSVNTVIQFPGNIAYANAVSSAPILEKQLPKTAVCSGINLKGMLDWANTRSGASNIPLKGFDTKRFSPKQFVKEFNQNAPKGLKMHMENPTNQEALKIIDTQLKKGIPIPMIYVPIGGNVKAPHFATIVDSGKLPNGTLVYKIEDSMRDVIPKEWLTQEELLECLNFKTLQSEKVIENMALRTFASTAQWHLGGNTLYVVDGLDPSIIGSNIKPKIDAANDPIYIQKKFGT